MRIIYLLDSNIEERRSATRKQAGGATTHVINVSDVLARKPRGGGLVGSASCEMAEVSRGSVLSPIPALNVPRVSDVAGLQHTAHCLQASSPLMPDVEASVARRRGGGWVYCSDRSSDGADY